jgi:soluble lytic murein transglycosylase-like protein
MFVYLIVTLQFNLPTGLIDSVCYVESKNNPSAIHKHDGDGNSIGLCQIKLKTAKQLGFKGTEKDLFKPEVNAYYAAKYLKHQINRYNSIEKGVIAYNQGHAGVLTSSKYQAKVFKYWRMNGRTQKLSYSRRICSKE